MDRLTQEPNGLLINPHRRPSRVELKRSLSFMSKSHNKDRFVLVLCQYEDQVSEVVQSVISERGLIFFLGGGGNPTVRELYSWRVRKIK